MLAPNTWDLLFYFLCQPRLIMTIITATSRCGCIRAHTLESGGVKPTSCVSVVGWVAILISVSSGTAMFIYANWVAIFINLGCTTGVLVLVLRHFQSERAKARASNNKQNSKTSVKSK
ncbi:hypothetical protein ACB098_04G162500 [Castanea mollissima]